MTAGRGDTSILILPTARRIAPSLSISVVIPSLDNEANARQAGANTVISPASFAGLLVAGSTHGLHLADYMADLAVTDGRVSLRERASSLNSRLNFRRCIHSHRCQNTLSQWPRNRQKIKYGAIATGRLVRSNYNLDNLNLQPDTRCLRCICVLENSRARRIDRPVRDGEVSDGPVDAVHPCVVGHGTEGRSICPMPIDRHDAP